MDIDTFWKINEKLPIEGAEDVLAERLEKLTTEELIHYQNHFDRLHTAAYSWSIWGAAYTIIGGCSDDGFIDFRYGLIAHGRNVYETAMNNPDMLAELLEEDDEVENEAFGYVAGGIYNQRTKADMPRADDIEEPDEPLGEQWDFDDRSECLKRLPRIVARYWPDEDV